LNTAIIRIAACCLRYYYFDRPATTLGLEHGIRQYDKAVYGGYDLCGLAVSSMTGLALLRGTAPLALAFTALGSDSHLGAGDWGASEISQLFEKAGVEIPEESINKVGLTPHALFDGLVTVKVLQDLGVTDSLQQTRALKTIEDLDDMITHAPGDFFEWRAANLQLFDFWIAPLAMSCPRVLAIWARYFTQHYGDDHGPKESAFGRTRTQHTRAFPLADGRTWALPLAGGRAEQMPSICPRRCRRHSLRSLQASGNHR
jgi:hypothetical protein